MLSHSESLAEAEQQAIEQGTAPVMEFVSELSVSYDPTVP